MDSSEVTIECATCPATGTTACGDCVVTHLLANDDGPIEYEPAPAEPRSVDAPPRHSPPGHSPSGQASATSDVERVIELFAAAGLLDDPPLFVEPEAFRRGVCDPPLVVAADTGRAGR